MSLAELRKKSSASFDILTKELEKTANNSGNVDERFWKPELDKSGNGYAVIRFLPAPEGEELPWAKIWSHAFQGPGGWYIENSLTTINQQDPVGDLNRRLWATGKDADKEVARKQKRKLTYYSNIYVVSDPSNPANEGKVFLFKYGKKIFDKIMAAMQPEFADETPINPFDLWKGANFKLKIRKVEGYWNYDKSEFADPTALSPSDAELERIYKDEHSLAQFVSMDNFKTYDELKQRLDIVLGNTGFASTPSRYQEEDDDEFEPMSVVTGKKSSPELPKYSSVSDDDDQLSYFARLAEED
jgi:hypothetical protein